MMHAFTNASNRPEWTRHREGAVEVRGNPNAVAFNRETWYGHLSPGRRRRHVAAYRDDPDDVPTKPLDLPIGYPGVAPDAGANVRRTTPEAASEGVSP